LGDEVKLFDNSTLNGESKNVVVVGGGDTAMDCVRTAIRQKAKSVKCLYRRDRENMPGSAREVSNAIEEGIEFLWLSNPKKFIGKTQIEAVEVTKMELGEPDSSGRKKPIPIKNSDYKLEADMVIKALGFDPENIPKLFNCESLVVSKWGTIKIDLKTMQTDVACSKNSINIGLHSFEINFYCSPF
jgi:glutamate synthase (NADPH/NADH) small chain